MALIKSRKLNDPGLKLPGDPQPKMLVTLTDPVTGSTKTAPLEDSVKYSGVSLSSGIIGQADKDTVPDDSTNKFLKYSIPNDEDHIGVYPNFLDAANNPLEIIADDAANGIVGDLSQGVVEFWGQNGVWKKNITKVPLTGLLKRADLINELMPVQPGDKALDAALGPNLTRKNEDFTPQTNLDLKNNNRGFDIISLTMDDLTLNNTGISFATGVASTQANSSALDLYELPVNWDSIDWYQQYSAFYGLALYNASKSFIPPAATDGSAGMKSVSSTQYPDAAYVKFSFNKTAADFYNFKLNIKTKVDLSKNYYQVQDMFDNSTYDRSKLVGKVRKVVYSAEVLSQSGKTVNSSGAITNNSLFNCSTYINISGFDTIRTTIPYSSFAGIALYSQSLALVGFVSGNSNLRRRTFAEIKASDYPTAVYAVVSDVASRRNDFVLNIYFTVISYLDGMTTEDRINEANGYSVQRIGYNTNQFSLSGFYKIDGTLNTSFSNYRSTGKVALPSGWVRIKYSTWPSSNSGIVFWDKNLNVVGMASMPSNLNYMEAVIERASYPTAKYYGYSWNDTFPPLNFRILSIADDESYNGSSNTGGSSLETRIANIKIDSLATFNAANPSTPITSEILFDTTDVVGKTYVRIPTVIITNEGTLLAAAEYRSVGDDLGEMDVFIKRKVAGGSEYDVIQAFPYDSDTYGRAMNPSFVIDRTGAHGVAGRIYMHVLTIKDPTKTANISPTADSDHLVIQSDDDGVTWSAPVSLKSKWSTGYTLVGVAPNNGIQTADGTLYIPCMAAISGGNWRSALAYKTPSGDWTYSGLTSRTGDNECAVSEYNGKILLSCRYDSSGNFLHSVYQYDMATNTFVAHDTDRTFNGYLPSKFDIEKIVINGKTIYLKVFCDKSDVNTPNPNNSRYNLAIWASTDMLKWIRVYVIDLNRGYGYAVLSFYNNQLVVAYETITSTLVVGLQDLTPLLASSIEFATTYLINRTPMELLNELIYKKNFNSY